MNVESRCSAKWLIPWSPKNGLNPNSSHLKRKLNRFDQLSVHTQGEVKADRRSAIQLDPDNSFLDYTSLFGISRVWLQVLAIIPSFFHLATQTIPLHASIQFSEFWLTPLVLYLLSCRFKVLWAFWNWKNIRKKNHPQSHYLGITGISVRKISGLYWI